MESASKKISSEIRAKIVEQLATPAWKELFAKTKAASEADSGSFKVVISTNDVDRMGDVVDINGWDLSNFQANPVVLWAHDYGSLPVGFCTMIGIDGGKLVAEGRFVPGDANPFAQQVRKLYDLGALRATSVGFMIKESNGPLITKAELLEFSFVPVPANPYALTLAKAGMKIEEMVTKGLLLAEKKDVEDDEKTAIVAALEKIETACTAIPALEDSERATIAAAFDAGEQEIIAVLDSEVEDDPAVGKVVGKDDLKEKTGRVLSEKNRTLIKDVIDSLEKTSAALKDLHQASDPQGGEGEEQPTKEADPKQRSKPSPSVAKDFEDFFAVQQAVKAASTALSKAGEKMNLALSGARKGK